MAGNLSGAVGRRDNKREALRNRPEGPSAEASPLLRRFASRITDAAQGMPILDVACGAGRNAIFLAQLGCAVVCIDRDLTKLEAQLLRLKDTPLRPASARLTLTKLNLIQDSWPFGPCTVGGIINVHFYSPALFPLFKNSLALGSYLLFETIPGCGGNYVELPKAGEVRLALGDAFHLEFYREARVGPARSEAATVRLLARKRC